MGYSKLVAFLVEVLIFFLGLIAAIMFMPHVPIFTVWLMYAWWWAFIRFLVYFAFER